MKEVSEVKKKLSSLKSEVLLESLQSMIFRFYNYQSTPAVIYSATAINGRDKKVFDQTHCVCAFDRFPFKACSRDVHFNGTLVSGIRLQRDRMHLELMVKFGEKLTCHEFLRAPS